MKFNRERFINETIGHLGTAIDMIDELVDIINGYIDDDEMSEINGSGCYGKGAEAQVLSCLKNKTIDEYIIK